MKSSTMLVVLLNTARLFKSGLVLAALICLSGIKSASAIPITYTFSGIGSGSLGASTFADSSFTITCTADTSQIIQNISRSLVVPVSVATIFVSSLGTTETVISPTEIILNQRGGRITYNSTSPLFFPPVPIFFSVTNYAVFSTYDLITAIGPITTGQLLTGVTSPPGGVRTTAGDFTLTAAPSTSFQASVPDQSSTLVLFGLGMTAIWCCLLATKRHSKLQLAEVRN